MFTKSIAPLAKLSMKKYPMMIISHPSPWQALISFQFNGMLKNIHNLNDEETTLAIKALNTSPILSDNNIYKLILVNNHTLVIYFY